MTDDQLLYATYLEKKSIPPLLDPIFPQQTNFVKDPSRLKALFCTRRAAKSYTGGIVLVDGAQQIPEVNCLYIGLTRMSAEGIIWKDVLKAIDKKHQLGMTFNGSKLTATTKNGSVIYVTGADADEDEMEKLLGKKYFRIVIDEAASFTVDLRRLIYGILGPATADQAGTISLMGTSGDLTQGLFFDVTQGKEPGWKLFEWTAHDNPYVARQWQEDLDTIKRDRPLFMETALFKQWYLNQWVIDTDKLVYKFNKDRNLFNSIPHYKRGEWSYVLGVDLGYEDASAFVVTAFHEHDNKLYIAESFKQTKMDITDVANKIKSYQSRYNIFKVVIDGANKQAVEEIQKRHSVALTAADKTGKVDFIEIMNAEFIQGNILVCAPTNEGLITEYTKLIWETDGEKIKFPRKEHATCENHTADAALYAWRYCYQFLSAPEKPRIDPRSKDQWIAHTQAMMDAALDRQIEKQKAEESQEDYWNLASADSEQDVLSYYLNKKRAG